MWRETIGERIARLNPAPSQIDYIPVSERYRLSAGG
jgi:hypothetical protein